MPEADETLVEESLGLENSMITLPRIVQIMMTDLNHQLLSLTLQKVSSISQDLSLSWSQTRWETIRTSFVATCCYYIGNSSDSTHLGENTRSGKVRAALGAVGVCTWISD